MNQQKFGALIRVLRREKGMTQKALADRLGLSDKAVSKWERGLGCPDVSLLGDLSVILGVDLARMLSGELAPNDFVGGNMKKAKFYVCPVCGNLTLCTGNASVSCCGRTLEALDPKKADDTQKLKVEVIENDWYITSDHPMTKENYISFVAFATGGQMNLMKQYPEWDLQVRLQKRGHGMLYWYASDLGLMYQLL